MQIRCQRCPPGASSVPDLSRGNNPELRTAFRLIHFKAKRRARKRRDSAWSLPSSASSPKVERPEATPLRLQPPLQHPDSESFFFPLLVNNRSHPAPIACSLGIKVATIGSRNAPKFHSPTHLEAIRRLTTQRKSCHSVCAPKIPRGMVE